MTDTVASFRVVPDGYDRAEVDRVVAELVQATKAAQQHAHDLHTQLGDFRNRITAAEVERDKALVERDSARTALVIAEAERDSVSAEASAARDAENGAPDFARLGDHIGVLLQAAHEAASRIRAEGLDEVAAARAAADDEISTTLDRAKQELAELARHRSEVLAHLARLRDALAPAGQV
jgi:hypothetical protein